ncbi:MAG: GNAT family N-acetyltransferase [Pseudomonadota bacterium]
MAELSIRLAEPTESGLAFLFERHLKLMHASSPACSVHAKPAAALAGEETVFLVGDIAGQPITMGAVQDLGDGHFEVKSMHVVDGYRGQGIARTMLTALIDAAIQKGAARMSLETGSQPVFAPARALYSAFGFEPCPPFADYTDDPNSYYMSKAIA